MERLLKVIEDGEDDRIPPSACDCLLALRDQLEVVKHQIFEADRRILAWHGSSEISRPERLGHISKAGRLRRKKIIPTAVPFSYGCHGFEAYLGNVGLFNNQSRIVF